MARLLTEHCRLNYHFYNMGIPNTPTIIEPLWRMKKPPFMLFAHAEIGCQIRNIRLRNLGSIHPLRDRRRSCEFFAWRLSSTECHIASSDFKHILPKDVSYSSHKPFLRKTQRPLGLSARDPIAVILFCFIIFNKHIVFSLLFLNFI